MIDCRQQIAQELETVCDNVMMSTPDRKMESEDFPFICFSLQGEDVINFATHRLRWRIAVYAQSLTDLLDMVADVDSVMHDTLGYTCTAQTPDGEARVGTDLYLKRLDYSARVDLIHRAVVRNTI